MMLRCLKLQRILIRHLLHNLEIKGRRTSTDYMKYLRGQIAVIMTLVIATLLGAMALGVDVGVFYYQWGLLQKAADAGVLAGSGYLTGDPLTTSTTAVNNAVTTFAENNGVAASEIVPGSIIISNQSRDVQVTLRRTVPYFFARLLGLTTGVVSVTAKAGINNTLSPMNVAPLGLHCSASDARVANCNGKYTPYLPGAASITLLEKQSSSGTQAVPGNWNGLEIDPNQPGAANFRDAIVHGADTPVSVGDVRLTETGNLNAQFKTAMDTRMSNAGQSWNSTPPPTLSPGDAQIILVPMVDLNNPVPGTIDPKNQGKFDVTINGFAEMYVIKNADNSLSAYFLKSLPNAGLASINPCEILGSNEPTQNPDGSVKINSCTPVLKQ
jgi:Flp pilus assembly protein TadG